MSISVDLADLEAVVAGRWGYLIVGSSQSERPPKVMALCPRVADGVFILDVGLGGMYRLAQAGGVCSFVLPPTGEGPLGEYSLVIDGALGVDGDLVQVVPASAVWHRPAPRSVT